MIFFNERKPTNLSMFYRNKKNGSFNVGAVLLDILETSSGSKEKQANDLQQLLSFGSGDESTPSVLNEYQVDKIVVLLK